MQFQASPPSQNELHSLRNELYKKHLLISIPAAAILFFLLLFLSLVVVEHYNPSMPEFVLPHVLAACFRGVGGFVGGIGGLVEGYVGRASAAATPGYYRGVYMGLTCVMGRQQDCQALMGLAGIAWQFQTNPHLQLAIKQLLICSKSTSACVSTGDKPTLLPQQLSLLHIFLLSSAQPPFSTSIDSTLYLINPQPSTVTLAKLHPIPDIISKIASKLQMRNQQYYRIEVRAAGRTVGVVEEGIQGGTVEEMVVDVGMGIRVGVGSCRLGVDLAYVNGIPSLVVLILTVYIAKTQRQSVTRWVMTNFSRKQLINKLYRYTIRDIFSSTKPNISNVLQSGPSRTLFLTLSQLTNSSIVPIPPQAQPAPSLSPFKFPQKLLEISQKYQQLIKGSLESKNKYVLANRFNLQTFINDLCEADGRVMREYGARCADLGVLREFFRFGYMAVLRDGELFGEFITKDGAALPDKLLEFFTRINQNIHEPSVIYDRLDIFSEGSSPAHHTHNHPTTITETTSITQIKPSACPEPLNPVNQNSNLNISQYIEQNKQQLQFRVRVYIIPKYLLLLKELDSGNYAEELGLERELRSLGEVVENMRYLLTKHNKSMRAYCK